MSLGSGIWTVGLLVFTLPAKVAIPVELGTLRHPGAERALSDSPP